MTWSWEVSRRLLRSSSTRYWQIATWKSQRRLRVPWQEKETDIDEGREENNFHATTRLLRIGMHRALCVSPRERRSLSRFNCKFLLPDLLANCSTEPVKPLPLRAPVINTEFLTKIIYSLKIIFIFFFFFFKLHNSFFFVRFRYNGRYGLYIEWKRGYVKEIFVAKADSWTRCNELQLWRCRVSMGLRPRNKLWK